MVVEMPVLDNALLGCALAFTPLMVALTFGERRSRARSARAARLVPRAAAAVAGRHRARLGAPGPGAERRRDPGPVLRPHRAAPRGAPHVRGPDAGDRPPLRRDPPVLRRGHARRRAAERAAAARRARSSSCGWRRTADRRDRRVPRRVLEARRRRRGATARAPSAPSQSGARRPSARRACSSAAGLVGPATASATQWRTWPSSTWTATCSSAVWTAATWVRMSMQ